MQQIHASTVRGPSRRVNADFLLTETVNGILMGFSHIKLRRGPSVPATFLRRIFLRMRIGLMQRLLGKENMRGLTRGNIVMVTREIAGLEAWIVVELVRNPLVPDVAAGISCGHPSASFMLRPWSFGFGIRAKS
jgi:hypothetical protein